MINDQSRYGRSRQMVARDKRVKVKEKTGGLGFYRNWGTAVALCKHHGTKSVQ